MSSPAPVRRALLSVSDKADLVPFARALADRGVELISTGGTAAALRDAGLTVRGIEEVTGFPEMMDGRVKTLHPRVHGGLLGLRDNPSHAAAMDEHGIEPIDLVCVNLYPFERTVADPGVSQEDAIEQIDIGGPSMLRSAAKNFRSVTVVTVPGQYDRVIADMDAHGGATTEPLRAEFAAAVFARTSAYDAAIASCLQRRAPAAFPRVLESRFVKADELRYGENPHQQAVLYRDPASTGPTVVNADRLHGKELSYNNINDAAAAMELVKDLRIVASDRVGAAVIKHTNACGAAVAADCLTAVRAAVAGDPTAAFGGVLALNAPLDTASAQWLCGEGLFLEVLIAPSFDAAALGLLRGRWKNLRVLAAGQNTGSTARKLDTRSVPGGLLVQDRDTRQATPGQWQLAAGPGLAVERLSEAAVVWTIVKHQRSNAVAIGGADADFGGAVRLFGAGMGLVDRVTASRLAVEKAGAKAQGAIAASDAFFPFADGPGLLLDAGVSALVHPGGSKRDDETFALCTQRGASCVLTGVRHFKH